MRWDKGARAEEDIKEGRLIARPGIPTAHVKPGKSALGIGEGRDGFLYVPRGYRRDPAAPLVLLLHGAGGNAQHGLAPLLNLADEAGLILVAPDSRRQTWDVILGGYGPDVAFIDRALAHVFAHCSVDPAHVAVGGFSDGASYAVSLGVTNGDLFTHVLAFSPGFAAPAAQRGSPKLFVSHGTHDTVLPIDPCSRRLVPTLRRAGYTVEYREFEGGHTVPPAVATDAVQWFLGRA